MTPADFWIPRYHNGIWVSHRHVLSDDKLRFVGQCKASREGFAAWVPRPIPPDPREVIACATCRGFVVIAEGAK